MAITISKKFSILVDSEAMLKELNCDKTVSQITANVDYFYRSPERFEACAELDITISKIEIEVNIGRAIKKNEYNRLIANNIAPVLVSMKTSLLTN